MPYCERFFHTHASLEVGKRHGDTDVRWNTCFPTLKAPPHKNESDSSHSCLGSAGVIRYTLCETRMLFYLCVFYLPENCFDLDNCRAKTITRKNIPQNRLLGTQIPSVSEWSEPRSVEPHPSRFAFETHVARTSTSQHQRAPSPSHWPITEHQITVIWRGVPGTISPQKNCNVPQTKPDLVQCKLTQNSNNVSKSAFSSKWRLNVWIWARIMVPKLAWAFRSLRWGSTEKEVRILTKKCGKFSPIPYLVWCLWMAKLVLRLEGDRGR